MLYKGRLSYINLTHRAAIYGSSRRENINVYKVLETFIRNNVTIIRNVAVHISIYIVVSLYTIPPCSKKS